MSFIIEPASESDFAVQEADEIPTEANSAPPKVNPTGSPDWSALDLDF